MAKRVDLINQKFGRLSVIRYIGNDKRNNAIWECICECGIIKNINGKILRSGGVKSCGCLKLELIKKLGEASIIDITGNKYGRLTVIQQDEKRKNNQINWKCVCDCGKKDVIVKGANLKNGRTKSCGCLQRELASVRMKKYNTYDLTNDYGIGYDSVKNKFYFDLNQYEKLSQYYWYNQKGYLISNIDNKTIYMHRFILNLNDDEVLSVDHMNRKKYDNRKENLRLVTQKQNTWNSGIRTDNVSGVTGVYYIKKKGIWLANMTYNYKQIHLGFYKNKEDAIQTREIAELLLFKEYSPRYHELKEKYTNEDISHVEAIIKKKKYTIQVNT